MRPPKILTKWSLVTQTNSGERQLLHCLKLPDWEMHGSITSDIESWSKFWWNLEPQPQCTLLFARCYFLQLKLSEDDRLQWINCCLLWCINNIFLFFFTNFRCFATCFFVGNVPNMFWVFIFRQNFTKPVGWDPVCCLAHSKLHFHTSTMQLFVIFAKLSCAQLCRQILI